MPYNVTVNTGDVADKATTIQGEVTNLESQLTTLTNAMADLAGTWTGPASTAFQDAYQTWKTTAQQTQTALDDIAKSLRNAGNQYDENENAIRGQWA
jgi:6 kDa early secretory antigenic target